MTSKKIFQDIEPNGRLRRNPIRGKTTPAKNHPPTGDLSQNVQQVFCPSTLCINIPATL